MKSMQFRLSLGLFVSLIAIFLILWWLASSSFRYLAEEHVISHMEHDAESILAAINFNSENKISIDPGQVEPVYLRPFSGQYYSAIVGDIKINSPSLMGETLSISVTSPDETNCIYQVGPKMQPLIVFARKYNKQGRPLTIILAEDLTPTLSRIKNFQYRFTVISLVCLAVLIMIQIMILRSGFTPLKRIQSQLGELKNGKRAQLDSNVPHEVSALVSEVNSLLKVMERRMQRSRNALGDLAHSLKTPLTVLHQLAHEEAVQSQPEICKALETQTTNMRKIMDHVLKRARLAGEGRINSNFNIEQEMHDLANALKSIYREKGVSIYLDITVNEYLPADREDMLELLGNLMDNACKWSNSTVKVSVFVSPDFRVIIEDDGPGVTEEFKSVLTNRGTRLDEAVTGYGLGLSIVKYIVEQYKGTIEFSRSVDLKGLRVEVNLPIHSSTQNSFSQKDKINILSGLK